VEPAAVLEDDHFLARGGLVVGQQAPEEERRRAEIPFSAVMMLSREDRCLLRLDHR
jgi:hypothetical protein